jgi:hypothetical protein
VHENIPTLGMFSRSLYAEGPEREKTPNVGVFSCSLLRNFSSGRAPSTKRHPTWVSFQARRCGRAPSMKRHPTWVSFHARRMQKGAEHEKTPNVGVFSRSSYAEGPERENTPKLGVFSHLSYAEGAEGRRAQKHTQDGWFSHLLHSCRVISYIYISYIGEKTYLEGVWVKHTHSPILMPYPSFRGLLLLLLCQKRRL